MSFLNDPKIDTAPSDKPKRLSKLGTNNLLSKVRAIPEIGNIILSKVILE